MNDDLDDLKKLWSSAKAKSTSLPNEDVLLKKAAEKKRNTLYFQYSTISILSVTAIVIYIFFCRLYPYQELLSKTGIALMIGSLSLRILIEAGSSIYWSRINLYDSAADSTSALLGYYKYRKSIHGPVTFIIVAVYTIGYYLILPEFSRHALQAITILLCASYPVGALLLIIQIRKGIKKEMKEMREIIALKEELSEEAE